MESIGIDSTLYLSLFAIILAIYAIWEERRNSYAAKYNQQQYCRNLAQVINTYFQFLNLRIHLFSNYPFNSYSNAGWANGSITFNHNGQTVNLTLQQFPDTLPPNTALMSLTGYVTGPLGTAAFIDYNTAGDRSITPLDLAQFNTSIINKVLFKKCVAADFQNLIGFNSYSSFTSSGQIITNQQKFERFLEYLRQIESIQTNLKFLS